MRLLNWLPIGKLIWNDDNDDDSSNDDVERKKKHFGDNHQSFDLLSRNSLVMRFYL